MRILLGHDVPNWAFIAMTLLAVLLGEGFTALIDKYERENEIWCGCDCEGMAHVPGSKGFACGAELHELREEGYEDLHERR